MCEANGWSGSDSVVRRRLAAGHRRVRRNHQPPTICACWRRAPSSEAVKQSCTFHQHPVADSHSNRVMPPLIEAPLRTVKLSIPGYRVLGLQEGGNQVQIGSRASVIHSSIHNRQGVHDAEPWNAPNAVHVCGGNRPLPSAGSLRSRRCRYPLREFSRSSLRSP